MKLDVLNTLIEVKKRELQELETEKLKAENTWDLKQAFGLDPKEQ